MVGLTWWPQVKWGFINFVIIVAKFEVRIHQSHLQARTDCIWEFTKDVTKVLLKAPKNGMCCRKHWSTSCWHLCGSGSEWLQPICNEFNCLPFFICQGIRPKILVNMRERVDNRTVVKCTTWRIIEGRKNRLKRCLTKHLVSWWPASFDVEDEHKIGLWCAILGICSLDLPSPTFTTLRSWVYWANDFLKLKKHRQ